ncbi:MAG: histidine phosphatase family protein [Candidatus Ornithomonoglobus sp.]
MVRIYIIRHGETEPNTRFACLGRLDVPLNENGLEQTSALTERIKNVYADKIYISPLSRAYETIKPYCELHPKIPVITENGITERDYGEWDNMSFAEIEASDPARYALWQENFTGYRIPGGESSEDVQERVNEALDRITSENDGKTVFLVTHLGTARQIISRLLCLSLEESWRFTMNNASCSVIDYDNNAGCGVLKYLNI